VDRDQELKKVENELKMAGSIEFRHFFCFETVKESHLIVQLVLSDPS